MSALSARTAICQPVQARAVTRARATGRCSSVSVVAREAAWAPGSDAPAQLNGSMVGDFGFDPLGLAKDPVKLKWYQQAELQHCRWAMLGAAGVLAPDVLSHVGITTAPPSTPNWIDAATVETWAPASTLAVMQLFLMGWAEYRRWGDMEVPGSTGQDPLFAGNKQPAGAEVGYPGGVFDPLGKGKASDLNEMKLKEIKNGRLAMVAFVGFVAQAAHTGTYSPVENLATHLGSPFSTTVLSNFPDLFVWRWADASSVLSNVAPIRGLPLV